VAHETHFNPVSGKCNLATNYLRCHAEPVEALFLILDSRGDTFSKRCHLSNPTVLGNLKPGGQFIILHIKMSNRAKGIAQKPSEPRVHIKDEKGNSCSFSAQGQKELDNLIGNQIPIDQKLELHQSVETQVVFDIPQNAKKLYALIEEGPFITNLLLQDDKQVFLIH
jgi:hypothetical protein